MSTWRRRALILFPQLSVQLQGEIRDSAMFFMELVDLAEEAHKTKDIELLRRILGFAEWSLHQDKELWNGAGIGFYESLFDLVDWEEIVPWLSPFAAEQIRKTWAVMGREGRFDKLLDSRREFAFRRSIYYTGEVETL
jgi:hypothetical protein